MRDSPCAGSSSGRFMAWIHFTQGEAFDYIPLKLGLGYLKETDYPDKRDLYHYSERAGCRVRLCSKIYTTRLKPLKPHLTYTVVKGSRYSAKPVEPRIEFRVKHSWKLNLKKAVIDLGDGWIIEWGALNRKEKSLEGVNFPDELAGLTYPELDLGYKYATFEDLVEELLHLNKKATLDTPFYVNRLIPARNPALQ